MSIFKKECRKLFSIICFCLKIVLSLKGVCFSKIQKGFVLIKKVLFYLRAMIKQDGSKVTLLGFTHFYKKLRLSKY